MLEELLKNAWSSSWCNPAIEMIKQRIAEFLTCQLKKRMASKILVLETFFH